MTGLDFKLLCNAGQCSATTVCFEVWSEDPGGTVQHCGNGEVPVEDSGSRWVPDFSVSLVLLQCLFPRRRSQQLEEVMERMEDAQELLLEEEEEEEQEQEVEPEE